MNNRILGSLALMGAPFLCINTYLHVPDPNVHVYITDSLSGLFDLFYISGWICSIIGLRRMGATGNDRFGRIIIALMLGTLALADLWNVYELILPNHNTVLYHFLDSFWPISNVVMIGVGVAVIRARKLTGWKRYAPLLCGLWLPVTILVSFTLKDSAFLISNAYTAITWTLLAITVLSSKEKEFIDKKAEAYTEELEMRVI